MKCIDGVIMNRSQAILIVFLLLGLVGCNSKKKPKKPTTQENTNTLNTYGTYYPTYSNYNTYNNTYSTYSTYNTTSTTSTTSPTPTPTPTSGGGGSNPNPWEPTCDINAVDKMNGTNYNIWCRTLAKRGKHFWDASVDYNCGQNNCTNAFLTDGIFKFRVKVLPQPSTCDPSSYIGWDGNSYSNYNSYPYNKLRFDVSLYLQGQANPFVTYYASNSFGDPISVGALSPIMNVSVPGGNNGGPVIARIHNVRSDYACNVGNNTYCPAEYSISHTSCWAVELQIETDYTQSFVP